jgi:SAM-dependent methyltransferase
MAWEIFEPVASGYEAWYGSRRGRRVDRAEKTLLDWLLVRLPATERVLEVGCGTGHFSRQLASRSLRVVGLDRSPAMLASLQKGDPEIIGVRADAHSLPFRDRSVDTVLFVTSLEFLEDPTRALAEAVRVARRALILLVLNRWSLGGISRRIGPQSRQPLLSQARDHSLVSLRSLIREAAGNRLEILRWGCILFPTLPWWLRLPVPVGDVIGVAAGLTSTSAHHNERKDCVVAGRA